MNLNDGDMFVVDYDKILQYPNIPTYVKAAIYKGKLQGYLAFEEFLRELSENDLKDIQALYDQARTGDEEYFSLALAISAALAQLEGVFIEDDKSIRNFVGTVLLGVNLEALCRKGFVTLKRQNLNFLATDEPVVELTDKGREYSDKIKKGFSGE